MSDPQILEQLHAMQQHDVPVHGGRTLAYVYDSGLADADETGRAAVAAYAGSNGLDPTAFPSLLQMENDPAFPHRVPAPPAEREGTLWFLFHGWEGGKIRGDHKRLIDEISETEDGPVTFSLYYTEYDRPEIRNAYLDAGFEVTSFGRRGFSYVGTDTQFLYKQLKALRRHKRVAGNRLATALFYGAAAGCEVAVYGDPMLMDGEDERFGGYARVRRLWPEMIGKDVDQRVAQQITREELGARHLLTPGEVRRTMFDGIDGSHL